MANRGEILNYSLKSLWPSLPRIGLLLLCPWVAAQIEFEKISSVGEDSGLLHWPGAEVAVAIDSFNRAYVVDSAAGRVVVVSNDGHVLNVIEGPGEPQGQFGNLVSFSVGEGDRGIALETFGPVTRFHHFDLSSGVFLKTDTVEEGIVLMLGATFSHDLSQFVAYLSDFHDGKRQLSMRQALFTHQYEPIKVLGNQTATTPDPERSILRAFWSGWFSQVIALSKTSSRFAYKGEHTLVVAPHLGQIDVIDHGHVQQINYQLPKRTHHIDVQAEARHYANLSARHLNSDMKTIVDLATFEQALSAIYLGGNKEYVLAILAVGDDFLVVTDIDFDNGNQYAFYVTSKGSVSGSIVMPDFALVGVTSALVFQTRATIRRDILTTMSYRKGQSYLERYRMLRANKE